MFKKVAEQFVKFGLIGALNTVISMGIFFAFRAFGISEWVANPVAFVVCTLIAYVLQVKFVFKSEGKQGWKIAKSYIVYGVDNLIIETALISLLIHNFTFPYFLFPDFWAKVIPMFYTIPANFLLHKFWVYKEVRN